MADLHTLHHLVGKYVDIEDSNGEGLSGLVVRVHPYAFVGSVLIREVEVDYGYAWPVSAETSVRVVEDPGD